MYKLKNSNDEEKFQTRKNALNGLYDQFKILVELEVITKALDFPFKYQ